MAKAYVKLGGKNAGKEAMSKDLNATKHRVITIQSTDANIIISKI